MDGRYPVGALVGVPAAYADAMTASVGSASAERARHATRPSSGELTLGRWIRDRAVVTPARVAIEHRGEPTTYAELDARSERLAQALLRLGLRRGDRVASLTANRPEHVELLFACLASNANCRAAVPVSGLSLSQIPSGADDDSA